MELIRKSKNNHFIGLDVEPTYTVSYFYKGNFIKIETKINISAEEFKAKLKKKKVFSDKDTLYLRSGVCSNEGKLKDFDKEEGPLFI